MTANVPAVSAAVRILERLAAERPRPVSPGTLVSELGLNRSTCYNILATLQASGWAASTGRAGWTLGPRLLALTGVSQELVAGVVQDELDALSRKLGFVAFAAEFDGTAAFTVVAKAERANGIRVSVGVGDRFPFAAPALLQAFTAWLPESEVRALVRRNGLTAYTRHTVTEPAEFDRVLGAVRADGFSRSVRQLDLSQGAAGATVFDSRSRPLFAVVVLGFSSELDEARVDEVGPVVRACADRITLRIGGTPPAGYPTTGD
ncbi:IclR family transcriptional regulator [Pseudonocardia nematodicida]|uniref:IclR family transcriptional regulator n=1 Tax=Pseudonocardia nematodicida TaxID=1206997 RepID=A0ABV1KBG6_9PSEU